MFENHFPDNVVMPEVTIRRGTKVALRGKTPNDVYEVQSISEGEVTCALVQDVESEMARQLTSGIDTRTAVCHHLVTLEDKVFPLNDLVAVAQRGDVIYPYLKPMDSVENAPDSGLWHTLIEADNYHVAMTVMSIRFLNLIVMTKKIISQKQRDWLSMFKNVQMSVVYKC